MWIQITQLVAAEKKILCFLLFAFLFYVNVKAQPRCKVEYYSTEQGLSHQRVTSMMQDKEGFMWFGSWDGINRFDGHSFVSYKSSPGDSSQLVNDRIDQMVEDQYDHLWVVAYDAQVYRFEKKTGKFLALSSLIDLDPRHKISFRKILAVRDGFVWIETINEGIFCVPQSGISKSNFTRYRVEADPIYQLPANSMDFFHYDTQKNIWIGTSKGLACLEPTNSGVYQNSAIKIPEAIAGLNFTSINENVTHIYFGTADGNLITYNKRSKYFNIRKIASARINEILKSRKQNILYATLSKSELITVDLQDWKTTTFNYRGGGALLGLYEDKQGNIWIEPEDLGVLLFDPLTHTFDHFTQKNVDGVSYIGKRFKIVEDNNGTVWIIMKGGGFGYYNTLTRNVENIIYTPDVGNSELPAAIYGIYYDKSGVLWLNTYDRDLVKIILQNNHFSQQLLIENKAPRSENEVRAIYYDNKERIWVGVKSGKLHVFHNNERVTGLLENEPARSTGGIYSIMQDSRGNVWIGTKGNGLYKAIPLNKEQTKYRLTHFFPDNNDPTSLPCKEVYSLLEDNQKRIWIGSFDKGLILVKDNGSSTTFTQKGNAFHNYPKTGYHRIRNMALDSLGNIWLATTDGLLILDANDNHSPVYKYITYNKIPGDHASLGNNDVQYIFRDSRHQMWAATSGGGFCQVIGNQPFQSLRFKNYTTRDGLPNDYVLSCAEDNNGNLWLATENGLTKFDPLHKSFRSYDPYDGLVKTGFSEAAVCRRLTDGALVFGTFKGFVTFDPDSISRNQINANIVFTNLQINNKDAGPGMIDQAISTHINYLSDITLKHNQDIISIDYSILDYRTGHRQAFAYRLLGFDSTWHDDRQLRRATYTNLPPGDYVFEVKSLSTDLYSNTPYKRLAITILPPFWKTTTAYIIYAIIIGILLFFIRRTALAMIRLRNKIAIEQKLAALKLNFFTNISHELRTPLTLIVNPLEKLSSKEKLSPEGAYYVDIARKNAGRMTRFINQLLDLRKVQSNKAPLHISRAKIVTFVKKIADHFTEAAASKQLKIEILPDQKELTAWVDSEKLDVVIYNLLANAIKFSPEGRSIKIIISTLTEEQSFTIALHDQGTGVEKDKLEKIFELFYEGDHPGDVKGTGIGLALSKEFVNLHGGKISAINNEDGGLTITVKLKLGFDHYRQEDISFSESSNILEKPIAQQLYVSLPKEQQIPVVLLVEDNDELRTFLRTQLSELYRVETARDGAEGFAKAAQLIPDLIVSDIMMPIMDGIQMLDKVKNEVSTSHIPVVLLSAKYSIESQIEGLQYGADHYITKPFNNEILIASINNLLNQRKKLFHTLVQKKKTVDLGPTPIVMTSKDETFLKEVIQVVENRMADPDFNIEIVAESMAMSRTTFHKKFKSLTGMTPVEFIRDVRLQRAKQYLDAGGNNVSEAAYLTGFNNPKYFSTCFKEKFQVSPSDYLKARAESQS